LVTNESEGISSLVLLVASDLIRDYSFQEPSDLRIRKRISPFPNEAFIDVFERNINKYLQKIDKIQSNFDKIKCSNREINTDIKIAKEVGDLKFSAAITSPPYVTALPYIDTQRISLVWLGLCESSDIMQLESSLIGSRELRNTEKTRWKETTYKNLYNIPERTYSVVNDMKNALSDEDGFRRQAVPILLYRYLSEMRDMFSNVAKLLKPSAPYALIVGHNRTSLGGKEFFIDTPNLLAELALSVGWSVDEIIPLDTYKRYGINSKNAINKESLILLRNIK
jgi:site-specific DNA-methyltransferase (cytosine-N4-specific)